MNKIKIAIIGVGSCASSLIHGIHYYRDKNAGDALGLLHWEIGGYRPGDIEVVAAFDIDERKVGKDVNEAIFSMPDCTTVFNTYIPDAGVSVQMGKILDASLSIMMDFEKSTREEVVHILKEAEAEVIMNYLPVGSEEASRFYAYCALDAGVSFVNNTSVSMACNPIWAYKFGCKNIPLIGDAFNPRLPIKATLDSSGVAIDSIRCAKLALNRGIGGVLLAPSAYFCKHPIRQFTYEESYNMIEQFINNEDDPCIN
ncbi:MAG: hypothetical protein NUV86_03880 [Candidatus Scalindua sp.]|nr:hypothetical protein [Candidatus Scalindua sp.]